MKKMFWVDLEMTGLDENIDKILEVAVIVTDLNFEALETYHRVVYQPKEVLDAMNDWCKVTHGKSGLTALVATGTPLDVVEKELLALAMKHFPGNEKVVLCGNSVGNDQRFLNKHTPDLAKKIHYRVVDVTSFKEIFRSKWNINVEKAEGHRALDDVLESIGELKGYLAFMNMEALTAANGKSIAARPKAAGPNPIGQGE
ncbi:MAG: oligoribonuclease [Deltaproteobacteria bacterium]|nr:oligoribonuclease [Deltaproteobacteria bacterium]